MSTITIYRDGAAKERIFVSTRDKANRMVKQIREEYAPINQAGITTDNPYGFAYTVRVRH